MKLSTKGRYAITAMVELALRQQRGPVTLADISTEQSISISYLEQLFAGLRKNGLVSGIRGPGGGYQLRLPAAEITITAILRAVDGALPPAAAETAPGEGGDGAAAPSRSALLWEQLSRRIYEFLDGITLADVVDRGGAAPGAADVRQSAA